MGTLVLTLNVRVMFFKHVVESETFGRCTSAEINFGACNKNVVSQSNTVLKLGTPLKVVNYHGVAFYYNWT